LPTYALYTDRGGAFNFCMTSTKIISIVIAVCLTHWSCSELNLEQTGQTFGKAFEKQKGRMLPVDRFYQTYTGCLNAQENLYNNCCYSRDTQTYLSNHLLTVKAVSEGMVVRAMMTEVNGIVIIKHGAYTSVYRNLEKIIVQEGTRIGLGAIIGNAGMNYAETHRKLLFELYNGSEKLQPKDWVLN
jgi:hypothetical protein